MPSTRELNSTDRITGLANESLPVIDGLLLEEGQWDLLVPGALAAARDFGFLCVDLLPGQQAAVDNALQAASRFFALDDTSKSAYRDLAGSSGWTASEEEPAYQPGTVSNVESFDAELPLVKLPAGEWPAVPGFRQAVVSCWHEYLALADKLLELLARAAGVEANFFAERCATRTLNTLRLLHYPQEPAGWSANEVGIAAHTDFECITLLYQTSPGLELRDVRGRWVEAPARAGRLIVLLDDMLERWTNGFFQATGHRVRRTSVSRQSLVMFIAVDEHVAVAPLPAFVSPGKPPQYTTIGQAEHIEDEMARARALRSAPQDAPVTPDS